jgi:hypothetical protein
MGEEALQPRLARNTDLERVTVEVTSEDLSRNPLDWRRVRYRRSPVRTRRELMKMSRGFMCSTAPAPKEPRLGRYREGCEMDDRRLSATVAQQATISP